MNKEAWEELVSQLIKYVRVNATPVGVKYFERLEDLKAVEKIRLPAKTYSPCTVISQAVQFGWTAACLAEHVHINYCRGIHGMFERDEKWHSGKIFDDIYFEKLEDSRHHHDTLQCLPAKYVGFAASPLASGRLESPDVCIIYANPAQVFMLLIGWQFFGHERLEFTFVGESTCSDSWVATMLTGKPKVSIPSFADRKFAGVREDELLLSMTEADLVRAVNGVKELFKRGIRYPIAPYSLTTDMIDGLPKSYLEY